MKKLILFYCLILLSCNNSNIDNKIVKTGIIRNIESLKTISLGQSDTITITFEGGTNGCAKPDHLGVSINGKTISFIAFYNIPSNSTICPDNIPIHTLKYVFKPNVKGTFSYISTDINTSTTTIVE